MRKHKNLLTEEEQKRLYLIHHMHHFQEGDEARHELHHCFLFSQPNMRGEKYTVSHLLVKDNLYHVLDRKPVRILYDHQNNIFQIKEKEFNKQKYYLAT